MQQNERYLQAKKTTLIGGLINFLLGVMKILGGLLFHSHALIADGVHSFSDLLTDVMVLFASKYGSQEADESHPYGHQRIETAATLLLSVALIIAGTGIAWDSLDSLYQQVHEAPQFFALPVALISILANEGLYHYTLYIGHRIQSDLLIANAWHHRSDAASSIVVFIGLIGSWFGFVYLDAVAAIVVGCLIIQMGISYGWNSVKELVDTAVSPDMLQNIEGIITKVDGVQCVHQLRSRMMGRDVLVDVHILVAPMISVSEGHFIAQRVQQMLVAQIPEVRDVTVHVDPEDDETACPSIHLPTRKELETKWLTLWQQDFPEINTCNLHYLDGQLTIDVVCEPEFERLEELNVRVKQDVQSSKDHLFTVRVFKNLIVKKFGQGD